MGWFSQPLDSTAGQDDLLGGVTRGDALSFSGKLLGGVLNYGAARQEAKAKKAVQAYTNKMVSLSNAMSQNSINVNQIFEQSALIQEGVNIQANQIQAQGSAEVQAAAAGVSGGSVNDTMLTISREAAKAEYNRSELFKQKSLQYDYQRMNINMQAATQRDFSYIAKPSILGSILGSF